ncbi:hypothetical protein AG1IA_00837 [Rhizoctonia solani AG-1 IA]|uniref:Uncharacterized protein n=1 Tax=Thanatephorus cucumeris (strain AG1-IA) TaxID=983506 RepID=L8X4A1_THACA|nr:hypothetical protein AG1IA_00837 [Rhizoctonia solani AG-1 IA]
MTSGLGYERRDGDGAGVGGLTHVQPLSTCLGQQFAYNEASFVLVRVLQRFDTLQLAMDAAPAGSIPPPEWRSQSGRASVEKVWPKNAVTLYSKGGMWVRAGRFPLRVPNISGGLKKSRGFLGPGSNHDDASRRMSSRKKSMVNAPMGDWALGAWSEWHIWCSHAVFCAAAERCVSSHPRSLSFLSRRTDPLRDLTPTLFGLRTSSRPASPAPCSKTSPPHVAPIVPTGSITPLDLSTPGSPIEGNKDKEILPRRPLGKLHLPSAFRRASPSPAPIPTPQQLPQPPSAPSASSTGSNYLDALALRISEAAGKAIAPPTPLHNSDSLLLHGRRPLPSGRGRLLGQLIQSEIHTAAQAGHDLLRASLRALHRPLNVLLTNVSTLLAPLVVLPPTNVLVPSSPWVQLGASQAHALGLATLVAELLASLDALPGDCAKVGGEGLRSIKQGLEGVISRVVQPVLTAVRTELVALVDALEQAPLGGGKKDNPLAGPVAVAIKVLNRVASVPGSVAGGAIAAY